MIVRQGDVLFKQISKLPTNLKILNTNVVAHGENGHVHTLLKNGFTLYEKEGVLYLNVIEVTPLVHEEHNKIEIAPGQYIIQTEKEYNPFDEEILKVKD